MAGAATETHRAREVYASLQAVSCPLVEGLYLQEADSMLQLLCMPSQLRTDILAWLCSSINPDFANSKVTSASSKNPHVLMKEMAMFGQELMLCKADDMDLIRGDASPRRQLQFLQQLLTVFLDCQKPAVHRADREALMNELFAADSLPQLRQMLKPTLDPWPEDIKALHRGTKLSHKQSREGAADAVALLKSTQAELEKLQSQCEFLSEEAQNPAVSLSSLRVATCDLQQLMATFSHVYESDLSVYCSRGLPSFSTEIAIFQRVHQLLLACNTELEMLKEVSETSASVNEEVKRLQTQPLYWSRGEKHTLSDQLEEMARKIRDLLSSSFHTPAGELQK